ncbi:MAG: HD domain-containing protein [Ignavibacteriaceae bacterium]|jgi:3'-5' exoribonuclease|nr:HD domain-containing protein [Ignavibacteriaceae bacterium]
MKFQTDLATLKKGDHVDHFLMIRRSEIKQTKANKTFVSLELGDKSISLPANLWDNFNSILPELIAGAVVQVEGAIEEYQNSPQLKIENIRLPKPSENISAEFFLPRSKRNFDEMKNEFYEYIASIENVNLKILVDSLFDNETFEKFSKAPAGKQWHHAYLHGLLEHTLEIVKICKLMTTFHKEINKDLLIAGAMLHDYGKIEELVFDSAFDYSDKGKLLGHIVLASLKVNEAIKEIPDFPEELKHQLLHLILSHQGKLENASPVVPRTLEAITLYHADELSAQTNAYKSAIVNDVNAQSDWTKYISLISTQLYKKEITNQ